MLAAAKEFAAQGYDKASTNNIVKEAGIGKGMLFYYFGSKLELYTTLLKQLQLELSDLVDAITIPQGIGIVETFQHLTRAKMKSVMEKPVWFDLITRIYLNPEELAISPGAAQDFADMKAVRDAKLKEVFTNADMSRLRKDIPEDRLIRHITFVMDGYSQHVTNVIKAQGSSLYANDHTLFWEEYDTFTEDLKKLIYAPDFT